MQTLLPFSKKARRKGFPSVWLSASLLIEAAVLLTDAVAVSHIRQCAHGDLLKMIGGILDRFFQGHAVRNLNRAVVDRPCIEPQHLNVS